MAIVIRLSLKLTCARASGTVPPSAAAAHKEATTSFFTKIIGAQTLPDSPLRSSIARPRAALARRIACGAVLELVILRVNVIKDLCRHADIYGRRSEPEPVATSHRTP